MGLEGNCACCKSCCYSTPYGTIFALSVTVVGLVGFLSSAIYSVVLIDDTPVLSNHTVIMASVVGGIGASSIVPLILATILAYCVTGYVRDELYHPCVKTCVGPVCNILIVLLTFLFFLLWLSLSIVISLLVAIYIQLAWACPQLGVSSGQPNQVGIMDKCFEFGGNPSGAVIEACVRDVGDLCTDGQRIGLALTISLAFALLVVIGMVLMLIVQAANFVSVRESNKRSYRPKGDY